MYFPRGIRDARYQAAVGLLLEKFSSLYVDNKYMEFLFNVFYVELYGWNYTCPAG